MFTVLKSETLFPEESFAVKVYVSVAYILLNSKTTEAFLKSITFSDAKRSPQN